MEAEPALGARVEGKVTDVKEFVSGPTKKEKELEQKVELEDVKIS